MKKSLVALAALATASAACAQSSVTVFGFVDTNYQHVAGDGNGTVNRMNSGGLYGSRLGFRGTEDLGGGMSASFWLESGIATDNGAGFSTNSNNQVSGAPAPPGLGGGQGMTFNRRSTVSLAAGWGELRLGRDFVPTLWNMTLFDPFFGNGVGGATSLTMGAGLGTNSTVANLIVGGTAVWASNSIGYHLPAKLGGLYGQAMYAMGENPSNAAGGTAKDGRHVGTRLGYASGPLDVAAAYGNTTYAAGDFRAMNIAGSWNFGVAKLLAEWVKNAIKSVANPRQTSWLIGTWVPVGVGEIRAAYTRTNVAATSNDADMMTVGYIHNLSKRTALYTTYARVNNKGAGMLFNNGRPTTTPGGNTTGFEIGVRHGF